MEIEICVVLRYFLEDYEELEVGSVLRRRGCWFFSFRFSGMEEVGVR